ncbi:MAG: hypothetical protein OXL95_02635 [Nitrospira sp.]|nr:hypothetical protein [Nitrospira sp.]
MDMKRFFLYAIVIVALALAGCGSDGNGGMTAMPDPDPTPTPDPCPTGQTRNADGDCEAPQPARMPPPMELVEGIVTANNDDFSAVNPAPYSHEDRPGKLVENGSPTGDVLEIGVKIDGTIGDVNIGTDDGDATSALTNLRELTKSDDMMPPSVGSFADGSVHSRTNMGVTDTAYVYETRDAPGGRAWDMLYPTAEEDSTTNSELTGTDAFAGIAEPDSTPAGNQGFNVITFGSSVDAIGMRFESDMFPSSSSQTYTYHTNSEYDRMPATGEGARGVSDVRGQMIDGMFHGIPGTYTCADGGTPGTCTVLTDNRGQVMTLGGTWTFRPDNLATGVTGHMVQGVVDDTDYLTFGYWVQKDESDDLEIGVSTFASGEALDTPYITAMLNLVGHADYDGKAVGKFVKKTLSPAGVSTITDGGTFTADASLKAYFGGNDISFNDRFTISGTINGFRNSDGDTIDDNWSVTLEKADFTTNPGSVPGTNKTTTQDTFMGLTSAGGPSGTWGGSFYGDSPATADLPTATENQKAYPSSVAGEFDAHFTNGHALGAFGAER